MKCKENSFMARKWVFLKNVDPKNFKYKNTFWLLKVKKTKDYYEIFSLTNKRFTFFLHV